MIEFVWAFIALFSWALSTFFISKGLSRTLKNLYSIGFVICISLVSGSVTTLVYFGFTPNSVNFNISHIIIGFLVFPIGTLSYYYCSYLYKRNSGISSQLSNSKNIISALFGVILGESLTFDKSISLILLFLGISLIIFATLKDKELDHKSIIFGLILALVWSLGDILISIETNSNINPIEMSGSGLVYSTILYIIIFAIFLFNSKEYNFKVLDKNMSKLVYLNFSIHGILSFSIGYTMFYNSVSEIGLSSTIIITSLWPILSIIGFYTIYHIKSEEIHYEWKYYLISGLLMLLGTIILII